jgi:hypothetical protein
MPKPYTRTITLSGGRTIIEHQLVLPIVETNTPAPAAGTVTTYDETGPYALGPGSIYNSYRAAAILRAFGLDPQTITDTKDKIEQAKNLVLAATAAGPATAQADAISTPYQDQHPLPTDVLALFDNLADSLGRVYIAQDRLQLAVTDLEHAGLCNGSPSYKKLARGRALYAIHATGQTCPMHGQPNNPAARIRKYAGQEQGEAARETLAAMARWEEYGRTRQQLAAVTHLIQRTIQQLHSMTSDLQQHLREHQEAS